MSAYIVSKQHIDAILSSELTRRIDYPLSWFHNGVRKELTRETADSTGGMLWQENVESVATCYPDDKDGERPGPTGLTMVEVLAYHWEPIRAGSTPAYIQPIAALKALDGYEYQACEHDEWERSEAKAFCDALRSALIRRLPGYEEAQWSWD